VITQDLLLRAYSVEEFCRVYPISKSLVYEAFNAGLLEFRYIGAKPIITEQAAQQFISGLPTQPMSKAQRIEAWGLSGGMGSVI
jgi:hypothetical protein